MLTGDAVAIAIETCKQLALGTNVYDSERLIAGGMAGSEVRNMIPKRFWSLIAMYRSTTSSKARTVSQKWHLNMYVFIPCHRV